MLNSRCRKSWGEWANPAVRNFHHSSGWLSAAGSTAIACISQVPPGEKKRFTGETRGDSAWAQRGGRAGRTFFEAAFFATATLTRTRSMLDQLASGRAVVCVEYEEDLLPYELERKRASAVHRHYARLVIDPE